MAGSEPVHEVPELSQERRLLVKSSIAIYSPLDETNKEIRLLSILANKGGLPKCELKTFSLLAPEEEKHGVQAVPPFEAFSYEWGGEATNKMIMLEGRRFPVRENLFTALQHLRSESEILWFWIDALCVNQIDFQERGHQVGLMEMIYTRADRVRVWLGPEANGSGSAFGLLYRIYRQVEITKAKEHSSLVTSPDSPSGVISPPIANGNGFGWAAFLNIWKTGRSAPDRSTANTDEKDDDEIASVPRPIDDIMAEWLQKRGWKAWNALRQLLDRTYWSRIWIVQEFVLARTITMHCGFHSVDWPVFQTALSQIMKFQVAKHPELKYLESSRIVEKIKRSLGSKIANMRIRGRGNHSLVELFEVCKASKCCDPRDRVYALLGLANDVPKETIDVDYTRSAVKVREDILKFLLPRQKLIHFDMDYIASLLMVMLEDPQKAYQKHTYFPGHGLGKP
jgi:hypothetical protein